MHNLEVFQDGSASFFAGDEPPWHRLGVSGIGDLSVEDALRVARLDWEVSVAPAYAVLEDGTALPVPNRVVTYREDPQNPGERIALGVVGSDYTVIQNAEALSFLDDLINGTFLDEDAETLEALGIDPRSWNEEVGRPRITTTGVLGRGEQIFATVKLPRDILVAGEDGISLYVGILSSHDGSRALTTAVTPVRWVCQNTVTAGLRSAVRTWKTHHTKNVRGRLAEARRTLELSYRYAHTFEVEAQQLNAVTLTKDQQVKILDKVWPVDADATERIIANAVERKEKVLALTAADPAAGTAWGLWNGVVEYVDFKKPTVVFAGDTASAAQRKAASLAWGPLADEKERAFRQIKSLVAA